MLKKDNNGMLRSARLSRQWTPEYVSEQVGVKLKTYLRWETGVQIPRFASLETLCKIFSMTVEELGFLDPLPRESFSSQQDPAQAYDVQTNGETPVGTRIHTEEKKH